MQLLKSWLSPWVRLAAQKAVCRKLEASNKHHLRLNLTIIDWNKQYILDLQAAYGRIQELASQVVGIEKERDELMGQLDKMNSSMKKIQSLNADFRDLIGASEGDTVKVSDVLYL